jgi:hypothetical protein
MKQLAREPHGKWKALYSGVPQWVPATLADCGDLDRSSAAQMS